MSELKRIVDAMDEIFQEFDRIRDRLAGHVVELAMLRKEMEEADTERLSRATADGATAPSPATSCRWWSRSRTIPDLKPAATAPSELPAPARMARLRAIAHGVWPMGWPARRWARETRDDGRER
jgi:hypothetical protein